VLGLRYLFTTPTINYYDYAEKEIKKYNPHKKNNAIIIDYRKNILCNRLYLLDMVKKEVILESMVGHAWNSGILFASKFSNVIGSNKSSLGTYLTSNTQYGKFGYSMTVNGLEPGINNNARKRAIIFHSNKKMLTFWSDGCFSTPEDINKKIIDNSKNGTIVCVIK
jgi:hypothetical protein